MNDDDEIVYVATTMIENGAIPGAGGGGGNYGRFTRQFVGSIGFFVAA